MTTRVGAVLIFKRGVTQEQARALLLDAEFIDHEETTDPQEFSPEEDGWPVWYVP